MQSRKARRGTLQALAAIVTVAAGAVAILGYFGIGPHVPPRRSDADLIKDFSQAYSSTDNSVRRLAPQIIDQISSPCGRESLRRFVAWNILELHLAYPSQLAPRPFHFDREQSDWHLLGDILLSMRDDDHCTRDFARWWDQNVKAHTLKRWPAQEQELSALYSWLESTYLAGPVADDRPGWTESLRFVRSDIWARAFLFLYGGALVLLAMLALHRVTLWWRFNAYLEQPVPANPADTYQRVVVQLPIYNERHVASRVILAAADLDWPRENFRIQVLDDSTDETSSIIQEAVATVRARGIDILHLRRDNRSNYKAGALAFGLEQAPTADLICVFDADFEPPADFLRRAAVHFADPLVGMVQARWTHANERDSFLTYLQARMLDGHFVVDHEGRHRSGCFFNFNGTAGIWRRRAILDAGGWQGDTLTEDLDLSYRAQLEGWQFVYRADIEARCELPRNMLALKAQQRRWSRGSLQTARKLLPHIWRSSVALRCKIEATAHLTSNLAYVAVLLAGCLLLPVRVHGEPRGWELVFELEVWLLLIGLLSTGLFYWTAGRYVGRGPFACVWPVPAIVLFGMGMAANNAMAALVGILFKGGEFVRTPKCGGARDWWRTPYRTPQPVVQLSFELLFFGYLLWTVRETWRYVASTGGETWQALPFPVAFTLGVAYVIAMTLVHLARQGRSGAPAPQGMAVDSQDRPVMRV